MKKVFPKLYKKTSTGAIQEWQISVYEINGIASIVSNYGQVNGKIQESHESVREGKNYGKKNETTALEQAVLQAESTYKKQLKKGYVETIEDAMSGKLNKIIAGGVFPMLAHSYTKQGHKIKYPALCQGKLDGHRSVAQRDTNDLGYTYSLWSRTRKPINSIPHINKALCKVDVAFLDGELYNHDYRNNFEDLTSLIRQDEPKEGHEAVQYHVYDLPIDGLTNYERYQMLEKMRPLFENTPIHIIETIIVNDEVELKNAFNKFIEQGYEGCMVRNMDGMYKYKRSYDLQKVKEFDDAEFKIVGVKVGDRGSMAGKAVFICEVAKTNETFDVKMKGSLDELKKYADDPELVIGKLLTVQFQGWTAYNKPRFPVGLRFRKDI